MGAFRALALTAATIAAMVALLGAAPASATQYTVLCVVEEAPCQAENVAKGGTKFAGESTNLNGVASYLGLPVSLTCEKSELAQTEIFGEKGSPRLEGSVKEVKFSGCAVAEVKCTVVGALNLPWRLLLGYKAGGGLVTVAKQPESNFPGVYFECGKLFSCNFYFSELDEELPSEYVGNFDLIHGGFTHQLYVNEVKLVSATGECMVKEMTVSGTYSLSQPEGLWVSYVE